MFTRTLTLLILHPGMLTDLGKISATSSQRSSRWSRPHSQRFASRRHLESDLDVGRGGDFKPRGGKDEQFYYYLWLAPCTLGSPPSSGCVYVHGGIILVACRIPPAQALFEELNRGRYVFYWVYERISVPGHQYDLHGRVSKSSLSAGWRTT